MTENLLIAGRYRIGEKIGQGGMGDVYLGEDIQTEQRIAIKSLKPSFIQPEVIERFEREGSSLRKLNHPRIVKVLDSVTENDQHYLVMEYVDGGSLAELLQRQRKLSVEQTI